MFAIVGLADEVVKLLVSKVEQKVDVGSLQEVGFMEKTLDENQLNPAIHKLDMVVDRYENKLYNMVIFGSAFGSIFGTLASLKVYHSYFSKKSEMSRTKKCDIEFQDIETMDEQDKKDLEIVIREKLVRNYQFFQEKGQNNIRKSYIVVIGQSGVGSHVACSLVRSGVESIKIIDKSVLKFHHLTSNAFANLEDVGYSKVSIVNYYLKHISKHCKIECCDERITSENIHKLIGSVSDIDFVVDCCDNIEAKTTIMKYCQENDIKVISVGDQRLKTDFSKIQIRDLNQVVYDPILNIVRIRQKKLGIPNLNKIKTLYSIENAGVSSKQENVDDEQMYPKLGTTAAIFGQAISSYVLCDLAEQPYNCAIIDDVKESSYRKLWLQLKNYVVIYKLRDFWENYSIDDLDDIHFVVRDMCNWRSVLSDKRNPLMDLIVWDHTKKIDGTNLVLLTKDEADDFRKNPDFYKKNDHFKLKIEAFLHKCSIEYQKIFQRQEILENQIKGENSKNKGKNKSYAFFNGFNDNLFQTMMYMLPFFLTGAYRLLLNDMTKDLNGNLTK